MREDLHHDNKVQETTRKINNHKWFFVPGATQANTTEVANNDPEKALVDGCFYVENIGIIIGGLEESVPYILSSVQDVSRSIRVWDDAARRIRILES